ncbi:hypothetical protein [Streptomyces sp. gb14]|uniref:hypothetical protein n=1 Tax=Streptomyces sp. gb14 TaxID=1827753 RepID=UPI0011813E12|nr:hypothetical protein [Streptomyces sp. gb14]
MNCLIDEPPSRSQGVHRSFYTRSSGDRVDESGWHSDHLPVVRFDGARVNGVRQCSLDGEQQFAD